MEQINRKSTRGNATLDLIFRKKMKELDFMQFNFRNMYSDHSTIGFRYCKNGTISEEYREFEIRKQTKPCIYCQEKPMPVLAIYWNNP